MTPDEVLAVARAGEKLGCTEALFSLGDKPELLFPEMRDTLRHLGYKSTLHYLEAVSYTHLDVYKRQGKNSASLCRKSTNTDRSRRTELAPLANLPRNGSPSSVISENSLLLCDSDHGRRDTNNHRPKIPDSPQALSLIHI